MKDKQVSSMGKKEKNMVGKGLRSLRLEHGYTQKRLCEVLKISYNTYIKVERKVRNPSFLYIVNILNHFGESLDKFQDRMYGHNYLYPTRQDGDPIYKECTRCRDRVYVTKEEYEKDIFNLTN